MMRVGDTRKKTVGINISIDSWLSGRSMAKEKGISFSSLMEELIKEAFDKFKASWTEVKNDETRDI